MSQLKKSTREKLGTSSVGLLHAFIHARNVVGQLRMGMYVVIAATKIQAKLRSERQGISHERPCVIGSICANGIVWYHISYIDIIQTTLQFDLWRIA
jgi:hypothetical protein